MDELVEKLCALLAEHALDGDGPADGAMRDALQKSGVADLVKDAERYRWLRKQNASVNTLIESMPIMRPEHLDAAIDAAMKGANT